MNYTLTQSDDMQPVFTFPVGDVKFGMWSFPGTVRENPDAIKTVPAIVSNVYPYYLFQSTSNDTEVI
jgi:hypothetical protein